MVKSYKTGAGLKAGVKDCIQLLFSAFATIRKIFLELLG